MIGDDNGSNNNLKELCSAQPMCAIMLCYMSYSKSGLEARLEEILKKIEDLKKEQLYDLSAENLKRLEEESKSLSQIKSDLRVIFQEEVSENAAAEVGANSYQIYETYIRCLFARTAAGYDDINFQLLNPNFIDKHYDKQYVFFKLIAKAAYKFSTNTEKFTFTEIWQDVDKALEILKDQGLIDRDIKKESRNGNIHQSPLNINDLIKTMLKNTGIIYEVAPAEYSFAHKSFLEFFAASYLVEALSYGIDGLEDAGVHSHAIGMPNLAAKEGETKWLITPKEKAQEVIKFFASHRYDPTFREIFKFAAAKISYLPTENAEDIKAKDDISNYFLEFIGCNIDGVIETSADSKIITFMHLFAQTKYTMSPEQADNAPIIHRALELINDTLCSNLSKWKQHIFDTGYYSNKLGDSILKKISDFSTKYLAEAPNFDLEDESAIRLFVRFAKKSSQENLEVFIKNTLTILSKANQHEMQKVIFDEYVTLVNILGNFNKKMIEGILTGMIDFNRERDEIYIWKRASVRLSSLLDHLVTEDYYEYTADKLKKMQLKYLSPNDEESGLTEIDKFRAKTTKELLKKCCDKYPDNQNILSNYNNVLENFRSLCSSITEEKSLGQTKINEIVDDVINGITDETFKDWQDIVRSEKFANFSKENGNKFKILEKVIQALNQTDKVINKELINVCISFLGYRLPDIVQITINEVNNFLDSDIFKNYDSTLKIEILGKILDHSEVYYSAKKQDRDRLVKVVCDVLVADHTDSEQFKQKMAEALFHHFDHDKFKKYFLTKVCDSADIKKYYLEYTDDAHKREVINEFYKKGYFVWCKYADYK